MRKWIFGLLMIAVSSTCILAQNEAETSKKSKVIVKKITVENVNGVETTKETTDTINLAELNELKTEGFEWNFKDLETIDVENLKSGDQKIKMMVRKHGDSPSNEKEVHVFRINPEHHALLEEEMKSASPNKAVLGVQLENVDGLNGAQVIEVFEGSAAEKIGLKEGDIILAVAGKETKDVEAVIQALSSKKPGDKVKLSYLRETKVKSAQAVLQERKEEVLSSRICKPSKTCKVFCCKPEDYKKCFENKIMKIEDGDGQKRIRIFKKGGEGQSEIMEIENIAGEKQETKTETEQISEEQSLNVEVLTGSPNPNNGQMKIHFEGKKEPTTIEVLDLSGKEVFKEKIDQFEGSYDKEIQIENATGTFILKVTQGKKVLTQKIIVK